MDADVPTDASGDVIYQLPSPTAAIEVLRLLIAADTFPRGGLYAGYYCSSAALRYEVIWLSVLREYVARGGNFPIPPLDVAFAWFVHRQFPVSYTNGTIRRCGRAVHLPREAAFAFGTAVQHRHHNNNHGDSISSNNPEQLWKIVAGECPIWPPPASGSDFDLVAANNDWRPTLASQLTGPMSRFSTLLHSWMRPHFLDVLFLDRARERYGRFLDLLAAHPERTLVPSADIALMWHTHLGLGGDYAMYGMGKGGTAKAGPAEAANSNRNGGCFAAAPIRSTYLDLEGAPLCVAYSETARLYERMYGEPYDSPDTSWLRPWELHPLAGPCSPLAFALRKAFEDVPSAATTADAADSNIAAATGDLTPNGSGVAIDSSVSQLHLSRRTSGGANGRSGVLRYSHAAVAGCSPRSNVPLRNRSVQQLQEQQQQRHLRAGAHALFAAWLVSVSAGNFFDRQTCRGLCFRSSWSIKVGTVERMVRPLVLLPYMQCLPDSSDHPFLEAVTLRRGLWRPTTGDPLLAVEEEQGREGGRGGGPGGGTEAAVGPEESCSGSVGGPQATSEERNEGGRAKTVSRSKSGSRGGGDGDGDGGEGGRRGMYLGGGFRLGDAEEFLNDPALWGLTSLMEEVGAANGGSDWNRTLHEEDEERSTAGGGDSGYSGGNARGAAAGKEGAGVQGGTWRRPAANSDGGDGSGGDKDSGGNGCGDVSVKRCGDDLHERYGSAAPLWGILRQPEYAKRARALFRHLWLDLGRRGSDHPLLLQTRPVRW